MMEKLGASLSRYSEYERLLGDSRRFQEALADVYSNVLVFFKKARAVFRAKRVFQKMYWLHHRNL